MQKEGQNKKQALNTSIKEGSAASASYSFGDSYISVFATEVSQKINPANTGLYIGALSALTSFISPLSQYFGAKLIEKHSRKKVVRIFVLLQALLWIPIAIMSFLFYYDILSTSVLYLTIIAYSLIIATGGIAYPAWFSWMGDLVDEKERGRYFSKRNLITGIVGLVAIIIGTFFINQSEKSSTLLICLGIFFIIASIFRLISFSYFKKQYHKNIIIRKRDEFSFWQFIKRYDNYGKFSVYQAIFNLSIMLASPFYIVYMKQALNYSYTTIMVVTISSSIFYLLFSKTLGKFADRYGNIKLMYIANISFALIPLLWILNSNPLWLIFVPQLIAGIGNVAFVLSLTNFTYDSVSPAKRGLCVTYTNMLVGAGGFIGAILGGLMIKYLTIPSIDKFIAFFIIAAIVRFAAMLFLIPLKEVKKVRSFHPFQIKLFHPFKTMHHEVSHFTSHSK